MELCRKHQLGKFVLASTSSLCGANSSLSCSEEADTVRPLSPDATLKKSAEAFNVTIYRHFTVYGPAGLFDLSLFRFIQWVSGKRPKTMFGDGKQSRDFTFVDGIASRTVRVLQAFRCEIVNLC